MNSIQLSEAARKKMGLFIKQRPELTDAFRLMKDDILRVSTMRSIETNEQIEREMVDFFMEIISSQDIYIQTVQGMPEVRKLQYIPARHNAELRAKIAELEAASSEVESLKEQLREATKRTLVSHSIKH